MDLIRKGRVRRVAKGNIVAPGEVHRQAVWHRRVYNCSIQRPSGLQDFCNEIRFDLRGISCDALDITIFPVYHSGDAIAFALGDELLVRARRRIAVIYDHAQTGIGDLGALPHRER